MVAFLEMLSCWQSPEEDANRCLHQLRTGQSVSNRLVRGSPQRRSAPSPGARMEETAGAHCSDRGNGSSPSFVAGEIRMERSKINHCLMPPVPLGTCGEVLCYACG